MSYDPKALRWRSFTAFMVTWSFLVMMGTGILLYFVPQGRVANWTDWTFLGLTKGGWGDIHIVFGLIFVIGGLVHFVFNWKPFKGYLVERIKGQAHVKKEMVWATLTALILFAGIAAALPPFTLIPDGSEAAKEMWVESKADEPPFGHAEEASVKTLIARMNMAPEQAYDRFKAAGIDLSDKNQAFAVVAHNHGLTPAQLYGHIADLENSKVRQAIEAAKAGRAVLTVDQVDELLSGQGVGRKTLAHLAETLGQDLPLALQRLMDKGFAVGPEDTLKTLADDYGLKPLDLVKMAFVADYQVPGN